VFSFKNGAWHKAHGVKHMYRSNGYAFHIAFALGLALSV
jgi:hypothetical protein